MTQQELSINLVNRKQREQKLTKAIIQRTNNIFGQSKLDPQIVACGIQHALQYPELSLNDAINIGIAAIKLVEGCSMSTEIAICN